MTTRNFPTHAPRDRFTVSARGHGSISTALRLQALSAPNVEPAKPTSVLIEQRAAVLTATYTLGEVDENGEYVYYTRQLAPQTRGRNNVDREIETKVSKTLRASVDAATAWVPFVKEGE